MNENKNDLNTLLNALGATIADAVKKGLGQIEGAVNNQDVQNRVKDALGQGLRSFKSKGGEFSLENIAEMFKQNGDRTPHVKIMGAEELEDFLRAISGQSCDGDCATCSANPNNGQSEQCVETQVSIESQPYSKLNLPAMPTANVQHYRFEKLEEGREWRTVKDIGVTVAHSDPMIDIAVGLAYMEVGVSICYGDKFNKTLGAAQAAARMLNAASPEYRTRIYLREVTAEGVDHSLTHWYKDLRDPVNHERIMTALADAAYSHVESLFFSTPMRRALRNGTLRRKDKLVKPSVTMQEVDHSAMSHGSKEDLQQPSIKVIRVGSLAELINFLGKPQQ
jgi:hypothetical protein